MIDAPVGTRIDAHHHAWNLGRRDQPWIEPVAMAAIRRDFGPMELAEAVAGCGIGATILVQVLNREDETRELLDVAVHTELVAGVVGWADLCAPDVADRLEQLGHQGPLVGIRHQLQAEPSPAAWLARHDVDVGLRHLADADLVFDLMIRPEQFAVALEVVRAHPALTFVVDHLGKPPISTDSLLPWASGLRRLAAEPNAAVKLSGLVTVADHQTWTVEDLRPYVEVALDAFGPARAMFGSDWPVCLLAASYADVVAAVEALIAELSADEQRSIWSATARRVYALG